MIKWIIRKRMQLGFIVGILLLVYLTYLFQNSSNQLLTDNEIQAFIEQKEITPILINNVGRSYTAILFNDDESDQILMYRVVKSKNNNIKEDLSAFYIPERKDKVDVEFFGTKPRGLDWIGYVAIVIYDDAIANEARKAKVILDNGIIESAEFNGEKMLLLPATREYFWQEPSFKTIEIYDANGEVLRGFYTSIDDLPNKKE